jgi:uncharacterized NAD(P)/FAD-binding protein YdhS
MGFQKEFQADVVVLATGFEQPQIDFLPEDLFPENYEVNDYSNAKMDIIV